jgi:putative peptidyl-prolyl cis-trans isomerase
MKKFALVSICCASLVAGSASSVFPWEMLDRVIAVVNERPIVESEVRDRYARLLQRPNLQADQPTQGISRVLDRFIEEALVAEEADNQAIIVSDEKIENHIKKIMDRNNIASLDDFKQRIQKSENIPFDDYREELRKSMITEQVMSIAIGVTPPTRKEMLAWYEANKEKLGFEVNVKHILMRPRDNSPAEERRVSEALRELMGRAYAGESFEALAAQYSEDAATVKNGGDMGWVALGEVDPYFANQVFQLNQPGQISNVIKSSYGYHIVKFLGKRQVSFEAVEDKILNMLFQQKMHEQFGKWINQRKRESDIKIYLQEYVKG